MKNSIIILFLLSFLFRCHVCIGQNYKSGHTEIEYNSSLDPGLSVRNLMNNPFNSSNVSIYNSANYRLDIGVRSPTFIDGPNNTYIQTWDNRPLDIYTGGKRRVHIDSLGRFCVVGDDLLTDTIMQIKTSHVSTNDLVGISSIITPRGISEFYGIGAYMKGGWRGMVGETGKGFGVEGIAISGAGVYGKSTSGVGVLAGSIDSAAIYGASVNNHGIMGIANGSNKAGVYGTSNYPVGYGVYGESIGNVGVLGKSSAGYGVFGTSTSSVGVYGRSTNNHGIMGSSDDIYKYDFKADGMGMDFGAGSSRRWKSNIQNIENPLELIEQLRGVRYDWDMEHGGGRHDIGFIAEEVGKVLPEIVSYEENGVDATAMDYTKIPALLVEAFNTMRKEYNQKFEKLENEVQSLKEKLNNPSTKTRELIQNNTSLLSK